MAVWTAFSWGRRGYLFAIFREPAVRELVSLRPTRSQLAGMSSGRLSARYLVIHAMVRSPMGAQPALRITRSTSAGVNTVVRQLVVVKKGIKRVAVARARTRPGGCAPSSGYSTPQLGWSSAINCLSSSGPTGGTPRSTPRREAAVPAAGAR